MNKKPLFIAAAFVVLCFAGLAFINSFIAEKIDDAISDQIREIENESDVKMDYDDLRYNLLTTTMTLEDFEFIEDKDIIEVGTIDLKIGLGTLRTLSESGKDAALSDFTLTCYEMDAFVDRESFEMAQGTIEYSGRISIKDQEFTIRSLRIELEEFESHAEYMAFEVGHFLFYGDAGDDGLDFETISNMNEASWIALRDIELKTKISDLDLPIASTREMELDEMGIETLLIYDLEFNANRIGDDLALFFALDTDMAEGMLDCAVDFSKSESDPEMEIELSLNNLDKDIRKILAKNVDWEKGRDELEFEFSGLVSELPLALMESVNP